MAHNIATINGKAAMAYQGDTPWHKLGTRMDAGAIDVGAALAAASLDWTVSLQHMFLADGREVPKKRAVVRDTDDAAILGTVSHWYKPIQYPDAFGIFQPAVEEFGLTIEAAGALGHGENGAGRAGRGGGWRGAHTWPQGVAHPTGADLAGRCDADRLGRRRPKGVGDAATERGGPRGGLAALHCWRESGDSRQSAVAQEATTP